MRGYIGNTDYDWYEFLASRPYIEEVNFWQPSGSRRFRVIQPGELFFFKLKSPHDAIAGCGTFIRNDILPAWLAWDTLGEGNGAPNFGTMQRRIEKYRKQKLDPKVEIGCLIVANPVFFPQEQWVPQPRDWPPNVVQGKTYDLSLGEGRRVLEQCQVIESLRRIYGSEPSGERYGEPTLSRPRLGQGSFRFGVIDAYDRACAVTHEHSLPVLEASHIKPFAEGGEHLISNGLLLRSDIHRLFDKGYVTVTQDHHFEVSSRLKEDYDNGKTYYPLHGKEVFTPQNLVEEPDPLLLQWHNENRFLG